MRTRKQKQSKVGTRAPPARVLHGLLETERERQKDDGEIVGREQTKLAQHCKKKLK